MRMRVRVRVRVRSTPTRVPSRSCAALVVDAVIEHPHAEPARQRLHATAAADASHEPSSTPTASHASSVWACRLASARAMKCAWSKVGTSTLTRGWKDVVVMQQA